MPWYRSTPPTSSLDIPNYGASTSHAVDHNGVEVVAAGTKARIMSVSVAEDADDIYVEYGQAPDIATGGYKYIFYAGHNSNKVEISAQSVYMATTEAGKTANIVVAVAQ